MIPTRFRARILVDVVHSDGRELHAEGESVSRMAIPISGVHGVCWQSLVRAGRSTWIDVWGDDQDALATAPVVGVPAGQMGLPMPAPSVGYVWT